jgi:hypothetical protein
MSVLVFGLDPRDVSRLGDVVVFVRVNQVLVRLWACLLASLTGCVLLNVLGGAASRVGRSFR